MSDININLDGVIAFLVAAALMLILLLGLAVFSFRGLIQARQKGERFSRQPIFPHLIGMLVSLSCCVVIMLLVWLSDRPPRPARLNIWLDDWVLLWVAVVLALWPVSSYMIKRRQAISPPGET
jgi:UDP-N-acetylmuramyl pentapeptide phosphotransferase/UDP-N-acetylglucosamine-1-phosphate transferase